jgi:hypothetical protein
MEALRRELKRPKARTGTGPIHFNQRSFRLPIRISPQALRHHPVVMVHVSDNHGKSYKLVSSFKASLSSGMEGYTFTAPRDGEYWFMVQTALDGKVEPPTPFTGPPLLKVIVDTQRPAVRFSGTRTPDGSARLHWNVQDDNLDLETLKLERQVPGGLWQPVPVKPDAVTTVTLKLDEDRPIVLRLRVKDRAGNETTSSLALPAAPERN